MNRMISKMKKKTNNNSQMYIKEHKNARKNSSKASYHLKQMNTTLFVDSKIQVYKYLNA